MMFQPTPRVTDPLYDWNADKMIEVVMERPDDFLKIRETLTRIGIVGKRPTEQGHMVLTQSAFLLHKKGRYYIVHYKELFNLDGKESTLTVSDIERRNLIISLLQDWGLVKVVAPDTINMRAPMSAVRVISHKEKNHFVLVSKYTIGSKR